MASSSTASIFSIPASTSQPLCKNHIPCTLNPYNMANSLFGTKLSISSSNSKRFTSKDRSTALTVSSSLPTGKPERAEKIPKWSSRAIKSFGMGELEARKLKYPTTGTEALLMGIIIEGTSLAAKVLRENGITISKVREEAVKLLGRSEFYYYSPEHPPLTKPAQRALDWAVDEKLKSGESGEITTTHILFGIWEQKESAGYKVMVSLGFNDEKAKELAKYMDKDIILSFK